MSQQKSAKPGYVWTWTEEMQKMYPDRIAGERCDYDGRYLYSVPVLWIARGFVAEKEIADVQEEGQTDLFEFLEG